MYEFETEKQDKYEFRDGVLNGSHPDYKLIRSEYNNELKRPGWLVQNVNDGKIYFITTWAVDSWDEGSIGDNVNEVEVFEMEEQVVTATVYQPLHKTSSITIQFKGWRD